MIVTVQHAVARYGPGEEATDFQPGDFILTHKMKLIPRFIRFAQRMRGRERKYSHWSHTAMITGADGSLVEAETKGVIKGNLSQYREVEYHLVKIDAIADDHDRKQAVAFTESMLGQPFGVLDGIGLILSLVTGLRLNVSYNSHLVCSALVARALERTDAIFDDEPAHMLPADLARYFNVTGPERSKKPVAAKAG